MKETIDLKGLSLGNLSDIKNALEFWIPSLQEGKKILVKKTLSKVVASLNSYLEESTLDEKRLDHDLEKLRKGSL